MRLTIRLDRPVGAGQWGYEPARYSQQRIASLDTTDYYYPGTRGNLMNEVVNLQVKLAGIAAHWTPGVVAEVNDYQVKLVKIQGEFVWHSHPETDELFLVVAGSMCIRLRDRDVELAEGELFVVPKGVEHKPVARDECHVLLLEPVGTVNTGDNPGEMTVAEPVRL